MINENNGNNPNDPMMPNSNIGPTPMGPTPEPMNNGMMGQAPEPMNNGMMGQAPEPMNNGMMGQAPEPMNNGMMGQAPEPMNNGMMGQAPEPMNNGMMGQTPEPMNNGMMGPNPGMGPMNNGMMGQNTGMTPMDQAPKKNNKTFIIIVAVLVVAIIAVVVIFLLKGKSENGGNSGGNAGDNPSVQPGDNPGSNPGGQVSDANTISAFGYKFIIPNGYTAKMQEGYLFVKSATAQFLIQVDKYYSYEDYVLHKSDLESSMTSGGITITTSGEKNIGGRKWFVIEGTYQGLTTNESITEFKGGAVEGGVIVRNSSDIESVYSIINNMLDTATEDSSSFAPGEAGDITTNFNTNVLNFEE